MIGRFYYQQGGGSGGGSGGSGGSGGAGGSGDGGGSGGSGGSGGGGGGETSWVSSLPDDLRTEKSFLAIKGKDWTEAGPVLAKQYLESQKYNVGAVRIPKPDAKPEEWTAFYQKIGRPEKPEEYGIAKPANMPAGLSWDDGLAKWFTETAFSIGMPKTMAQKFMSEWTSRASKNVEENTRLSEEGMRDLRQEWGKTYPGKVELGVRAASHLGGQEFVQYLNQSGMGNNPIMLKAFARVGKMLMDHGFIAGDGDGGALTKENMQKKIAEIRGDKKHPYNDAKHPDHNRALQEMSALYKDLYPENK